MAKELTVSPVAKNFKYTMFRSDTKYTLIDDQPLGDVLQSVAIRKSSQQAGQQGSVTHGYIAGIIRIDYDVPYIGTNQEKGFLSGISEFYNNVVGSALQATDISHADLAAYIVLSHEWRALVKDIDRVLTCYNQTSLMQPNYGKAVINAMTGELQGYDFIKANSAQLIEIRNLICEKISKKFPCVRGSTLSAFDDMMLDNVYCDDPDAKAALIVAHRKGYAINVSSNPLVRLAKTNVWNNFIVRWLANANLQEFVTDLIDDVTNSIWYTDVRPYIQNLINRGALQTEDAYKPFAFDVVNATWKPVYSTDFINFLKNVTLITEKNLPVTSWYFEEDAQGLFHYHAHYMSPIYVEEHVVGSGSNTKYYYEGGAIDTNKYFANMHSYPYTNEELVGVLVGAVRLAPGATEPTSERYSFGDTAILQDCCGGIVTSVAVVFKSEEDGFFTDEIILRGNFVELVGSEPDGSLTAHQNGAILLSSATFLNLVQLNCLPKLVVKMVSIADYSDTGSVIGASLISEYDWNPFNLDIDNMVEVPVALLRSAWSRYAYESVYAAGSSKMHNPLK